MLSVLIVEVVDAAAGEDEYTGTEEEEEEDNEDAIADMQEK